MPVVTCPGCKKTDKVPDKFIGARLKCKVCGTSILVTAQGAETITAAAPVPAAAAAAVAAAAPAATKSANTAAFSGIEVEGLDSTAWSAVPEPPGGVAVEQPEPVRGDGSIQVDGTPTERPPGTKEYKLLTPRDKCFAGKFDLERLESALNAFARQGWVVRSMATPQVHGFSGGLKEEFVVLLER